MMKKELATTVIMAAAALGVSTIEVKADTMTNSPKTGVEQTANTTRTTDSATNQDSTKAISASVSQAQANVDTATSAVSSASQAQAAAQVNADQASQAAADSKQKLDQLSPDDLTQATAAAQQVVDNDTTEVHNKTTDVATANSQATAATSAASQATSTAAAATDALSQAQVTADSAQNTVNSTQADVNATKDQLSELQDTINGNNPKLTVDVATWKEMVGEVPTMGKPGGISPAIFIRKYNAFLAQLMSDNVYVPSKADDNVKLTDLTALTQAQQDELMNLALTLINQAVAAWQGDTSHSFVSTRADMTIAQQVAAVYTANNPTYPNNIAHPRVTYNTATITSLKPQYAADFMNEGWANDQLASVISAGELTMGSLKQSVYQDVFAMMFENVDGYIMLQNWTQNILNGHVGLSFDATGNAHYVFHTPITDANQDTTPIASAPDYSPELAAIQSTLASQQKLADTALTALSQANTAVAAAGAASDQAQQALKAAQTLLADRVATVQALTIALNSAQTKLIQDLAQLASGQQALADLKLSRAQQAAILEQDEQHVTQALQALAQAKLNTQVAQAALKIAQQNLSDQQQKLTAQLVAKRRGQLNQVQVTGSAVTSKVTAMNSVRLDKQTIIELPTKQGVTRPKTELAKQSKLPQTDENNSVSWSVLAIVMFLWSAILPFGLKRRYRGAEHQH